jgi:hypothetical protein
MRVVGVVLAVGLVTLSGCAMTSSAGSAVTPVQSSESIAGVWRGMMTSRELNTGSGSPDIGITLVVAGDGSWTANARGERWKGTVRPAAGGFQFEGITGSSGRPVSFMLHRYGRDGLGGAIATDHQGRRVSMIADLRAVPGSQDLATDGDTSQPSASPRGAASPSNFSTPVPGGAPGRYPELRQQAP